MLDAGALIKKHQARGVLVDSNLLVLFLVGKVNKRRILEFKRTQNFTIADFDLLARLIVWFGKLIAFGELAIGICLIVGAFTGVAAFFGGFMNWNFMMAGSASTNPLLFAVAVFLILAWKTAGYYGLDRWLLPLLGTPWKPAMRVGPTSPQPVRG